MILTLPRALHHAEKRKDFSGKGEVVFERSEFTSRRKGQAFEVRVARKLYLSRSWVICDTVMLRASGFAETKVPRPWVRIPSDRIQ